MTYDDAPPLADLMPWSVAPPRLGRGWPAAPDPGSLKARWDALVRAEGADREALFEPTRARTLRSAVGQLPGQSTGTERLLRATGPGPEPVRVLRAPFDEQWLLPDHRLIDTARPELWRVAGPRQIFAVQNPDDPALPLLATSVLPLLGPVRPLYRRPDGTEPNLAPGLLDHLVTRLGHPVTPLDVLAWTVATTGPALTVPLTEDPGLWAEGLALGHRLLWLMRRDGERPRLPGGRRPYVRAPLPARPLTLRYDREEEALHLDEGRISPVPPRAWDFEAGGVRVLEHWFTVRTAASEPGTLTAIRPTAWPQTWTSELLELITVLTLIAELLPRKGQLTLTSPITATELKESGILPPPETTRRPPSVLNTQEEGPEGQLALL